MERLFFLGGVGGAWEVEFGPVRSGMSSKVYESGVQDRSMSGWSCKYGNIQEAEGTQY